MRRCEQGSQTCRALARVLIPRATDSGVSRPVRGPALVSHSQWGNVQGLPQHHRALDSSSAGRGLQHLRHGAVGDRWATEPGTVPCRKYMRQHITLPLLLWLRVLPKEPRNPMLFSNRPTWLLVSVLCKWRRQANLDLLSDLSVSLQGSNVPMSSVWSLCDVNRTDVSFPPFSREAGWSRG